MARTGRSRLGRSQEDEVGHIRWQPWSEPQSRATATDLAAELAGERWWLRASDSSVQHVVRCFWQATPIWEGIRFGQTLSTEPYHAKGGDDAKRQHAKLPKSNNLGVTLRAMTTGGANVTGKAHREPETFAGVLETGASWVAIDSTPLSSHSMGSQPYNWNNCDRLDFDYCPRHRHYWPALTRGRSYRRSLL